MTEDILFNNIYVGHSPEDAKALALETFEVKKPLEVALDKPAVADEDEDESISFKDDPIGFIRTRVLAFIEAAKVDPLQAFKTQPETGAALAGALFTLFGMLGALVSIIGGAQKPVVTKVNLSFLFLNNASFTLSPVCQEGRTLREKVGSRTRFLRYRLQERRWLEEAQCQVNGYSLSTDEKDGWGVYWTSLACAFLGSVTLRPFIGQLTLSRVFQWGLLLIL